MSSALLLAACEGKPHLDGSEMTDAETRTQVVDPAKRLVHAVDLQLRGADFRYASCTDQGFAPFRGRVGMGFTFPAGVNHRTYVEQIVAAMQADGWADESPKDKHHYGRTLHLGRVMAIVTPNPDHPDYGYVEILGECRNAGDHRITKDRGADEQDVRAELTR
ncbi:hypothetical protein H7H74_13310 [Mycolicibacterium chitae]|uniref:Lipoprotein lppJ n=2 Tax=Mycobacteriaceae TaxID=1762 RepID=A0A3S4S3Y2_MYCCI|nr:hypothetical protein [Mycolicibacterium chitae]VEG44059.1 lipoprotein lppJ [Mycolicibacterium chitae]